MENSITRKGAFELILAVLGSSRLLGLNHFFSHHWYMLKVLGPESGNHYNKVLIYNSSTYGVKAVKNGVCHLL